MSTGMSRTLWWAVAVVGVVLIAALSLSAPSSPAIVAAQGQATPGAVPGATVLPPPPAELVPIPEGASPMEIALIQAGRVYASQLGCLSCHSLTGRRLIGPSFLGLYGSELVLTDDSTVLVNEPYLRQAILNAHGVPVAGFPGLVMPDYNETLTQEEADNPYAISPAQMDALIAFLRALGRQQPGIAPAPPPGMTPAPVPGVSPETPLTPEQALVIEGRETMQRLACFTCHTTNGSPLIGPTFLGLFGSTRTLTDGSMVVADETYIRGSVVAAHAQVVEGFPQGVMPDYGALVTNDQLDAIVAYMQALGEAGRPVTPGVSPTPMMTPEAAPEEPLVAVGRQIALQQGCFACHTSTGQILIGPSFRGLYGSTRTLTDGSMVVADEDYLRLAIIGAHIQTVEGFPGQVMPNYAGVLDQMQLDALIAYIRSLAEPAPTPGVTATPGAGVTATPMPGVTATPAAGVTAEPVLAQQGRQFVEELGCLVCHTTNGSPLIGPTFLGLYGSPVTLSTGEQVIADEGYLRRSIIAAHAQVVEGFPVGVMPDYSGLIGQEELDAIVAYLTTLGPAPEPSVIPGTGTPAPMTTPEAGPSPMATPGAPGALEPTAQEGMQVASELGCFICHTTTGQPLVGPSFLGLAGSTVTLSDGTMVVADEEYLRRAILFAHIETVQGFPGEVMPDYQGIISGDQLDALVAYLQSLG